MEASDPVLVGLSRLILIGAVALAAWLATDSGQARLLLDAHKAPFVGNLFTGGTIVVQDSDDNVLKGNVIEFDFFVVVPALSTSPNLAKSSDIVAPWLAGIQKSEQKS